MKFKNAVGAEYEVQERMIVSIDSQKAKNKAFMGVLLTVTEVHDWGIVGYTTSPMETNKHPREIFYRAKWEEIENVCGANPWVSAKENLERAKANGLDWTNE